ncbi:hypothetical protein GM708_07310 [Vibrio cholerae]|nr:hypothetical protein [Vibrio cholerae]
MSDQVNGQPRNGAQSGASGDDATTPAAPWHSPDPTPSAPPTPGQEPSAHPWQAPGQQYPASSNPWARPGTGTGPSAPQGHPGSQDHQGTPSASGGTQPAQGWGPTYPPRFDQGGGQNGGPGAPYAAPFGAPHGALQPPYGAYGQPFPPGPRYQAPPKPGVIPLRPLGLGEILDGAFQACRKNPLATFGIAILLQAVVALVTVLLLGNLMSSFEVFDSPNPTPDSIIGALASLGVFASIAGIVSAVALLVLQGILVIPIARAVINQKTSFGQAWRLARGRLLPLFGFGLLSFAIGLVGLMLLVGISALAIAALSEYSAFVIVPLVIGAVVVMVWASVKLVVAPAAVMLEGRGPWVSIKRSWLLTRGNWWRTFGIVLLTSIIVSIIASVISTPLTFAVGLIFGFSSSASTASGVLDSLPVIIATQAITALFAAIGYAFQAGVTSLLYVDLRIRREGFDVVLMREHEQAEAGRADVLPGGTASFGHQPGGPS